MSWWLWLVLGLALLASEAFTPGAFFVFFFGLSAIAVGLAVWLGPHIPGWFQWFLFSLLSVHTARRSEEHTSELQSQSNLVCRLLLEKKKQHILTLSQLLV